jgi:probable F420-dependent oxidoreductase
VKFGLALASLNPARWREVTVEADRLGFESVWMAEHLVLPVEMAGSPHAGSDHPPIPPTVPVFDALAYLAYLAGFTERIRLGTYVYNIGLRHPFTTARAAATVDILSQGRLILGVGASWLRAEWEVTGLDFDSRGPRVDEAIDVCRRLWTEETVEHHGRFFDFGPVAFEPKPARPGGVALHVGGDRPVAIRRAARVGDGWLPMNYSADTLEQVMTQLREECDRIGRADLPEVTVGGRADTEADIEAAAAAGADRMIVRPWARSSEALEGLQRFRDRFSAHFPPG